ncbi:hypothetical protein HOU73_gp37 [Pectobacterium phage Koot]|uniref:Uncharacterized protein n=3 Tax=Phimunavirus koot TaxID=2733341 RepID=A0A3G8FIU6_9CAUD|nr:hypothetical protein HOU73_gp37 [Pectobacterium phage Koot]AXY81889.1 hypothetical protein [Pectobacterium phage Momine]AZF94623.1 hypothetical protein [Pectobacterium phage Koot]AZF94675.1 hypothetical protein [Pectobacterium phage Koot_B1]
MKWNVFLLPHGTSFFRWNGVVLELWLPDGKYWLRMDWPCKLYAQVHAQCTLVAKNVVFK